MFSGIRSAAVVLLVGGWLSAQENVPGGRLVKVPNVAGQSAKEARAALSAVGLVTRFKVGPQAHSQAESHTVQKVEPPAGTQLKPGAIVQLTVYGEAAAVDTRPSASTVVGASAGKLPGFVGMQTKVAKAAISARGLVPKLHLGSPAPSREDELTVYAQHPPSGVPVGRGQTVELLVYGKFDAGLANTVQVMPELTQVASRPFLDQSEDSIDPKSGRVIVSVVDLTVPAGGTKIELRRTWIATGRPGLLGSGWRLNWERRVTKSQSQAQVETGPAVLTFTPAKAAGTYQSDSGGVLQFDKETAVWTLPGGVREVFDQQGRLVERHEPNGNRIRLTYSREGRLSRIEGPGGAAVQFTSDAGGRLTSAESSTGDVVRYVYAGGGPTAAELPGEELLTLSYVYTPQGTLARLEHPWHGATEFAYDGQGKVRSRKWADGARESFVYDEAAHSLHYTDPTGQVTHMTWSSDGRSVKTTSPLERTAVIEYDEAGRTVASTGPSGQTARFTYDRLGRTTSVENPASGTTRFEYLGQTQYPTLVQGPGDKRRTLQYDAQANLIQITDSSDPAQNATFKYFPAGQVQTAVYGTGHKQVFTYDELGRRTTQADAAGNVWRYVYDKQGNVIQETDPAGGVTKWTYDAHRRPLSITDPTGATTRFAYEQRGRFYNVTNTDARGGVTGLVYDQRGRLATKLDPAGNATRYYYDPTGRLVRSSNPAGQTRQFEYDAAGRLVAETSPLGAVTRRVYDMQDQVVKVVAPDGTATAYEYSQAGQVSRAIDRAGLATSYEYDPLGRLVARTDAAQRTAQVEYDPSGRPAKQISASGPIVAYEYDAHGRLVGTKRGKQTMVKYEYDVLGHRTKESYATGLEVTAQYDALGRLVDRRDNLGGSQVIERDAVGRPVAMKDSFGAATKLEYDPAGNLLSTTDALGHMRKLAYDPLDRLVEVAEANGDVARYEYDAAGRLATVRHPGGGKSTYQYDGQGAVTGRVNPSGSQTKVKYDPAGRPVSSLDAKGQETRFEYDAAGRVVAKHLADKRKIRYEYDALGRLAQVDDGAYPVKYAYDANGRLARLEYPAIKRSLSWQYNDAGQKTKFVDSEGRTVQYEYDDLDRLTAIKPAGGGAVAFQYDAKSRVTSITWPNGVHGDWQFDAQDRPLKLAYTDAAGKRLAGWTYQYDAAGNRTQAVADDGQTARWRYDAAGQLIEEALGKEPVTKFTYLPGGNRAREEAGAVAVEYHYNAADQLLAAGKDTFRYDANGSLIERRGPGGVTKYTYDVENRLIGVKLPGGEQVQYRYAPTGERIARVDAKGTTQYVTDGQNLLAELDGNLKPKATYLHGPKIDQPLVMSREGQTLFFHADRLGSIARLTDTKGAVAASYDYDAFGRPRTKTQVAASPFTYTAREFDDATGLYYYRARYYDARLGRFLSADIWPARIEEPQSLNRYAYVENNPVNRSDPLGLDPQIINKNGTDFAVFYRGHNQVGIPVPQSFETQNAGIDASRRLLTGGINPQTGGYVPGQIQTRGLAGVLSQNAPGSMPHPALVPITEDQNMAARFAQPNGEVLELHVPVSELVPDPLGSPGSRSGGNVIRNPNNTVEREWVIPHEVPEQYIVGRTPVNPPPPPAGGGGDGGSGGGGLPDPPPDFTGPGKSAWSALTTAGTTLGVVNLGLDVAEGKPPADIAKDAVVGAAKATLLTTGGALVGGAIGGLVGGLMTGGPGAIPGAAAGAEWGAWMTGAGLTATSVKPIGERLGDDLGKWWYGEPLGKPPAWVDLPPVPGSPADLAKNGWVELPPETSDPLPPANPGIDPRAIEIAQNSDYLQRAQNIDTHLRRQQPTAPPVYSDPGDDDPGVDYGQLVGGIIDLFGGDGGGGQHHVPCPD